jgi:hypothetical protein
VKKSDSSVKKRLFFTLASMKKSRFGKETKLFHFHRVPPTPGPTSWASTTSYPAVPNRPTVANKKPKRIKLGDVRTRDKFRSRLDTHCVRRACQIVVNRVVTIVTGCPRLLAQRLGPPPPPSRPCPPALATGLPRSNWLRSGASKTKKTWRKS